MIASSLASGVVDIALPKGLSSNFLDVSNIFGTPQVTPIQSVVPNVVPSGSSKSIFDNIGPSSIFSNITGSFKDITKDITGPVQSTLSSIVDTGETISLVALGIGGLLLYNLISHSEEIGRGVNQASQGVQRLLPIVATV